MSNYTLESILATFSTNDGKHRLIYNMGPIGGINANLIKLFFIALPFIEFAIIFNPYIFNKLGIATAIVFFIVFLSIVMIIIFFITWKIKNSTIKRIKDSWQDYFDDVDINMLLSTGITPYSKFFDYYSEGINKGLDDENLYLFLKESFVNMQKDNEELLNAMSRENNK